MGFFSTIFGRKKKQATPVPPAAPATGPRAWHTCHCMAPGYEHLAWTELKLHNEVQDTQCEAWKALLELIEETRANKRKEFAPGIELGWDKWEQIVTLPPSIGLLKSVKVFNLYGSHLVRIPPEIGEMESLVEFNPYTSYHLHWFPYEITRCRKLKRSCVSTRALYGNYKYRSPFPRLPPDPPAPGQPQQQELPFAGPAAKPPLIKCSVCDRLVPEPELYRVWLSLRVATDVLPLLVNACSAECLKQLPPPAKGYVDHPHKGGLELVQPPTDHIPPGLKS